MHSERALIDTRSVAPSESYSHVRDFFLLQHEDESFTGA